MIIAVLSHLPKLIGPIRTRVRAWSNDQVISLDFEFIEEAQKENLAKRMEWYAAFGVLVTLVWVYLEMLRLLGKLRSK